MATTWAGSISSKGRWSQHGQTVSHGTTETKQQSERSAMWQQKQKYISRMIQSSSSNSNLQQHWRW